MSLTDSKFWKDAKQIDERDLVRAWLVWTVGTYANGTPWIELRSIYLDEQSAILYCQDINKYECKKSVAGGMWRNHTVVEPRVINHLYADEFKVAEAVMTQRQFAT